jgi:hypothetical protein
MTFIIPKKYIKNNPYLKNIREKELEAIKRQEEFKRKFLIIRFKNLTNMDEKICKTILESCNWDIIIALDIHFSK